MDESSENVYNEQIYESIAECTAQSRASSDQRDNALRRNVLRENSNNEMRAGSSCYKLALPIPTQMAKRAFKSGAEKFCDTMNSVCVTFGSLSQKLRRSTRRRAPLVNSPETPVRSSRDVLGRTPTKLYSPFTFDTPRGKENVTARRSLNRESFKKKTPPRHHGFSVRRRVQVDAMPGPRTSPRLSTDLQEAQIGVYEFQHTADRILRNFRH